MATTTFGLNSPEQRKVWAASLDAVPIYMTTSGRFTGKGANNIAEVKDELTSRSGTVLQFSLRDTAVGDGRVDNETLEGHEEAMETFQDELTIGLLRHAARVPWENLDAQRVPYDLRAESKSTLEEWSIVRHETLFFNHLCGFTPANSLGVQYTTRNPVEEYNAARIIRPDSNINDQTLTTGDEFTLQMIDWALEKVKTDRFPLRTVRVNGTPVYVLFLHPRQVTNLRRSGEWRELQLAAMQGGFIQGNPLLTGAAGYYNGVLIVESRYVTDGVDDSGGNNGVALPDVKRAVLCGAQSMVCGYGRWGSEFLGRMKWTEKMFDYDHELGVALSFLYGCKRARFDGLDYGSLLIPTYAPSFVWEAPA